MATFTTKQTVATEEDLIAPWSGYRDGRRFRCGLCGRFIEVGGTFRLAVLLPRALNTIVCGDCDGPDFPERWIEHIEAGKKALDRYWFLVPDDDLRTNPKAVALLQCRRKGG